MVAATDLADHVDTEAFLRSAVSAASVSAVNELLNQLPVVDEAEYPFAPNNGEKGWRENRFHWMPVGRDRGNAGRIKLANHPVNPIAERLINGMEAFIELARQREVAADRSAPAPSNPRQSVLRYFGLPPLDELPRIEDPAEYKRTWNKARQLAQGLRVKLRWDAKARSFAVLTEDEGIGQPPAMMHATLLSLGATTKGDKPYLVGVFGQGGSSAFAVSQYSTVLSRRAPDLLDGQADGVGWTVVRHVFPKGRRDDYFAYLAAHPDGRTPWVSAEVAERVAVKHGTRFAHIGYDFQTGGSAIARTLYGALNHVLYNPMLPYELYAARDTADVMWGNAYRLSNLSRGRKRPALDKIFPPQSVGSN